MRWVDTVRVFLPGSLNRLASLVSRDDLPVVLAEHRRDRLQRGRVGDPGEQQLGPEQGQEPVGGLAPAGARLARGPGSAARRVRPCPPPSDAICGNSCSGAMFATSSSANNTRPDELAGGVRPVRRAANLGQEAADDRRDRGLLLRRRVDVDGVAAGDERGRVEVRVARGRPARPRSCRPEARPRRRRRSRTARGPRCSAGRPATRTPTGSPARSSSRIPGSSSS